ncbi:hypothetical protein EAO75_08745 [Streptomyces sp. uw30]|nr:hypothetical protein EAO75_08745 [Streptomyces sp. uw30]
MVWIPGGSFLVRSEKFRPDERPVHPVVVDGFWMDERETGRPGRRPQRRDTAPRQHALTWPAGPPVRRWHRALTPGSG